MLLPILCVIFLFSGAAALLFETLWFRGAGLSFGNSVWASSITLAAYMGGLALGNLLAGRMGQRVRNPLLTYARLEILIATTGLILVALLPALASQLAPFLGPLDQGTWWSSPLRVALVFLLLMIPTTAMGATLPLLVMALCREKTGFGKALGYLYGFNTLGAMLGVLAGEAFLIEAFGLLGTGISAALLNGLAAVLSLYLMARARLTGAPDRADLPAGARPSRYSWQIWLVLLASGLAGAALLGAEVLWFRFLRLFFLDTDASFVVMLAVVLGGIGLGGLVAGAFLNRWPSHLNLAITLAGLCGLAMVLSYSLFDARVGTNTWHIDIGAIGWLSFLLMFPSALASGALFTFLGQALHQATGKDVEAAAALTTANTTGAMLGALVAAFVLLPGFGVEKSIWAVACVYGVVFMCLVAALGLPQRQSLRAAHGAMAISLGCAVILFPFGRMQTHLDAATAKFRTVEGSRTVATREGLTETLQYLRHDWLGQPVSYRLMTNGFSMSDSQPGSRRYMGLYAHWPAAVHPSLQSALLISYGLGNTAKSLTQLSSLREIHVVDISRDILSHAGVPYPDASNPLADARVKLHVDDGRYFLQATNQRFDLITSEPPPPRAPGVISLYTEEYFRLIHDRLTEGGLATYWLPVHNMTAADARAILKGFCNAFVDCGLWGGYGLNWMMTGSRGAGVPPRLDQFTAQWRDPVTRQALRELGLDRPEMLGATFMADAAQIREQLASTSALTDNFPKRYSQGAPTNADQHFYDAWMNPALTSKNFHSSQWVAHFWPAELRQAGADYFVLNQAVNVPEDIVEKGLRLQMMAQVLKYPGLETPILWLLGTNQHEVAIARANNNSREGAVAFVLGADALARGEVQAAAVHFERSVNAGDTRALTPLLFSFCYTGQGERAKHLAVTHALGDIRNSMARCW